MKILFALTYYRPHVSGVVVYVQRLAEALARRGHEVTVLTSRYDRALPREECLNGVRIVRVPVLGRVSKGAIMPLPSYARTALRLARAHDVIAMNLPNTPIETAVLCFAARWLGRPLTATYHCDVLLPPGMWNRVVNALVFASNVAAGWGVDRLIAYTDDYAAHSLLLRHFPRKREVIPPPVQARLASPEDVAAFRRRHAPNGEKLIGFAARFAAEKGVEYMVAALPRIRDEIPNVRVLFAGECEHVIGERKYWTRLKPQLDRLAAHWTFLGVLDPDEMAQFHGACDVTVLPSVNRTESFGLVQVESMLCGTPVVASDLPGVRAPIQTTGMGRVTPIRDAEALAGAVIEVIRNRSRYVRPRAEIEKFFSLEASVGRYEALFGELIKKKLRIKNLETRIQKGAGGRDGHAGE